MGSPVRGLSVPLSPHSWDCFKTRPRADAVMGGGHSSISKVNNNNNNTDKRRLLMHKHVYAQTAATRLPPICACLPSSPICLALAGRRPSQKFPASKNLLCLWWPQPKSYQIPWNVPTLQTHFVPVERLKRRFCFCFWPYLATGNILIYNPLWFL